MLKMKLNVLNDLPDIEIIEKVKNGETDLYEIIMRRYNQRLYRIGRGFFRDNDEEIEDIIQFTYIRAYEKLASFQNRSAFSTWLSRIFINEAIARKKYSNRFVTIPDREDSTEENTFEDITMKNPYTITANNELKDLLEKTISKLPEKYRLVFVMHEIEKLSILETADCLNITESNVKIRLNRARKMLRDNLGSYYKSEDIFTFELDRCDVIVNNVMQVIKSKKQPQQID